jgi:hypothetical protein
MSVLIIPDSLRDPIKRDAFIKSIERKIQVSVNCWEKTTDSSIPEKRRAEYQLKYERLTDEIEKMLNQIGIKVEWPGLHPVYLMLDGSTEHSIKRAVEFIFKSE